MRALLLQVLLSPLNAAAVIAGLTLLGRLQHPLLYLLWLWLAMAVLALVVLRFGPTPGLRVAFMASVWLMVASLLGGLAPSGLLVPFGLLALAVGVGALPLRWRLGAGTAASVTALVTLAYVAGIRLATGDVDRWWLESLLAWARALPLGERALETERQIAVVAVYMNSALAGVLMFVVLAALALGRYWEGLVAQARGFREELLRLELGRGTSLIGLAAFVLATQGLVWRELGLIAAMLGCLVGLAVCHARVQDLAGARLFLVGVYAGILVLPKLVVPAVVAVGYLDGLLDLRGQRGGMAPGR
jgi:hypothetical protein